MSLGFGTVLWLSMFTAYVRLKKSKWRILDKCHHARNLAEYEGHLDVNPQLLRELVSITEEVQGLVEMLARQHKE